LFLNLLIWGCDDQGLPPDDTPEPVVTVQFLEASCTEAWLRLAPRNVSPPYTVTLLRNDSAVATFSSPPTDTTVIDEGLVPSRTYTYRARLTSASGLHLTGDPVQARTLDTTSHQFTWETTVLGDGGSSIFYDVAIVNDTLAYAVGEVYVRDSSGYLDPLPYNLAVWNGRQWQLRKLTYRGTPPVIRFVFAVSERDIWFDPWFHWNGERFSEVSIDPVLYGVGWNKMWGSSAGRLYVVGNNGALAYSDNSGITWRRVESGTSSAINDVFGAVPTSGQTVWFAAASNRYSSGERKLLRMSSNGVLDTLAWSPGRRLHTVWYSSLRRIIVGGGGVHMGGPRGWEEVVELPSYYSTRIRGNGQNDVWVVGAFGRVGHFNGVGWRSYAEAALADGTYEGLAVSGGQILAVGQSGNRAVILRGRRN
jgi:hypothetical protein